MKRKSLLIMLLAAFLVPLAMNAQTRSLKKQVSHAPRPQLQLEVAGQLQIIEDFQPGKVYHRATTNTRDNVLYSNGFNSQADLSDISIYDNDGDGYNWAWYNSQGVTGVSGDYALGSQSYDNDAGALTPDNWLIMPAITLPSGNAQYFASIYARSYGGYGETIGIFVAPEDDDYIYQVGSDFNLTQDAFVLCEVDLSAYAGQTIEIYIRHYNCTDGFYLFVDDFSIYETAASPCNSVTFSNLYTVNTNLNGVNIPIGDNSSVTFAKGSSSNNPQYYTNGTAVRAYAKNTFTVTSTSNIESINITFGSSDGNNPITANTGTYSNGAWTGSATSVTFTVGGNNGNRRIAAIEVCVEVDHTCDAPTELSSADVTENSAALSWTGNADAYNIQYRVNDPTAPATLILNVPTDIWGDGTGYQLVLDADHNTYGSTIPSSGNFTAGSFAEFEYTIPENAECNASTNTIIVNGSATITIPAGVYDYVFLNPDPTSGTYYIASSNGFSSRGDDFEFMAGTTYEFTLSIVGQNDYITLTTTSEWIPVSGTVTSPYTLTGLDPETTYEWQVKGDGCENWSAIASFTTLEETSMPVQFTVNAPETAHPGDVITVEAVLTAPENYSGFTDLLMAINYDHTAFAFVNGSIVYGPVIAQAQQYNAQVTNITNVTDKIQVAINCFDEGYFVTADGIVFSAQFTVLEGAEGEYTFTAEPNGAANFDHEGVAISYEATPSTVVVAEPVIEQYFKPIAGWSNAEEGASNFYLIASPIGDIAPTAVTIEGDATANMVSSIGSYDLYYFDHNRDLEWVNYIDASNNPGVFNLLESGKGYLYANLNNVTLVFTGTGRHSGEETIPLAYYEEGDGFTIDLPGWNLLGNPFAETAYLTTSNSGITTNFYTMDAYGVYLPVTNGSIDAMEGVFVHAEGEGQSVTFTTSAPSKSPVLNLNLSNGRRVVDRAIVRFDGGNQLPKLQFRQGSTKVYIPVEGHDYAVVSCEEMGELPVSFKAEENGSYNLSLSSEEVSFAYLHLIDNMTGADVDLLQTPSYSFEAKATDYANRFKLVFATGDNSNDDNFAFFSNGSFVINNDGEATLQVIDVTGRILSSESINGCTNVNVNAASGVYMLRLINGGNVKVQKVVVK